MEIQILNPQNTNDFTPIIGDRTIELLDRFATKLDMDELNTTRDETVDILSYCIDPKQSVPMAVQEAVTFLVENAVEK